MLNIWDFIVQSSTVSLVAILVLLIKQMVNVHLSPRWQYGVWAILAVRIVLPVDVAKTFFGLPLSTFIELLRFKVETGMESVYSAISQPIDISSPLPFINQTPHSMTDWLFVIYLTGIFVVLMVYLFSYFKLRFILRKAKPIDMSTENQIKTVCEKYNLKPCKTVFVDGLDTAFVCGVIKPVLALPSNTKIDNKVILHELLHVKYKDALQSAVWCVFRIIHWCNPLMHIVFNRIANDMESLCDTRVLERLEGEERREYGVILLSMANEKFTGVLGTSNISNGGANIRRRIEAIVRFKKYPQGMAILSICIGILLALPTLAGNSFSYSYSSLRPMSELEFDYAMANARINRCETLAGALDTYAKSLIDENIVYLATVSPISTQTELKTQLVEAMQVDKYIPWYHYDDGVELEALDNESGYDILNLEEISENVYTAGLIFSVTRPMGEDGLPIPEIGMSSVVVYVKVFLEDGMWIVEETDRETFPKVNKQDMAYSEESGEYLKRHVGEGKSGTVTVNTSSVHSVNNHIYAESYTMFGGGSSFDRSLKPNAEFDYVRSFQTYSYVFEGTEEEYENIDVVKLEIQEIFDGEYGHDFFSETAIVSDDSPQNEYRDESGSSSDGEHYTQRVIGDDWDREIWGGGGGSAEMMENETLHMSSSFEARIYINDKLHEVLYLQEVE